MKLYQLLLHSHTYVSVEQLHAIDMYAYYVHNDSLTNLKCDSQTHMDEICQNSRSSHHVHN